MELFSLIWFLQIWVAIYVYGIMINWSTLIMKLMQTYIVKISGSILNLSTVHLNGIWHLIWRYLSKPVLGGHPVLSGHYSIPRGCPLNTGLTVFQTQNLITSAFLAFARKSRKEKFGHFPSIEQLFFFFFTRRHCQSNIETRWSDIIQKRRTGFCGD